MTKKYTEEEVNLLIDRLGDVYYLQGRLGLCFDIINQVISPHNLLFIYLTANFRYQKELIEAHKAIEKFDFAYKDISKVKEISQKMAQFSKEIVEAIEEVPQIIKEKIHE